MASEVCYSSEGIEFTLKSYSQANPCYDESLLFKVAVDDISFNMPC